jgi:hypothetical protein
MLLIVSVGDMARIAKGFLIASNVVSMMTIDAMLDTVGFHLSVCQ